MANIGVSLRSGTPVFLTVFELPDLHGAGAQQARAAGGAPRGHRRQAVRTPEQPWAYLRVGSPTNAPAGAGAPETKVPVAGRTSRMLTRQERAWKRNRRRMTNAEKHDAVFFRRLEVDRARADSMDAKAQLRDPYSRLVRELVRSADSPARAAAAERRCVRGQERSASVTDISERAAAAAERRWVLGQERFDSLTASRARVAAAERRRSDAEVSAVLSRAERVSSRLSQAAR